MPSESNLLLFTSEQLNFHFQRPWINISLKADTQFPTQRPIRPFAIDNSKNKVSMDLF